MSYMEYSNASEVLTTEDTVTEAQETAQSLRGLLKPVHVFITVCRDGRVLLEYDSENPIAVDEAVEILECCNGK